MRARLIVSGVIPAGTKQDPDMSRFGRARARRPTPACSIIRWSSLLGMGVVAVLVGCMPSDMTGLEEHLFDLSWGGNLIPVAQPWEQESHQTSVLGGTADRTIIARTRYPAAGTPGHRMPDPLPPETDILTVDLRTMESTLLRSLVDVTTYDLIADGNRIAWIDYLNEEVKVVDINSGVETRLFPGLLNHRIGAIASVSGTYLVLQTGPPSGATSELVVVNLETQESSVYEAAFLVNELGYFGPASDSVSLDADLLAMHVWLPLTGETDLDDASLLGSAIETIDLNSGQRRTLVHDASDGTDDVIFLASNRALLLSSTYEPSSATVRGYPIDGGASELLLEVDLLDTETAFESLVAFNNEGVLISTITYLPPPSYDSFELIEFRGYDGETVIVSQTNPRDTFFEPMGFYEPRLIENFVIYQNRETLHLMVFDLTTRTERRIDVLGG